MTIQDAKTVSDEIDKGTKIALTDSALTAELALVESIMCSK